MAESLQEIIARLWITPQNAGWTPRTEVVSLEDIQRWMASSDIEVLGFAHTLLSNARFRVEPPIAIADYIQFTKHYYERCLHEDPDGEWSAPSTQLYRGWRIGEYFRKSLERFVRPSYLFS